MTIPFDSLTLAAVIAELQDYVTGKVQRIVQPDEHQVGISLYSKGKEGFLLLSCDAQFARAHLVARRPANRPTPLGFCEALRARLDGGRVDFIRQVRFDRILHIGIEGPLGPHVLVAELMGKHSNLILVDGDGKVVSAAKFIGPSKSSRVIVPGKRYDPPPFAVKPPIFDAPEGANLRDFEGASPFLVKLIQANSESLPPGGGGAGEGGSHVASNAATSPEEPPEDLTNGDSSPSPLPPSLQGRGNPEASSLRFLHELKRKWQAGKWDAFVIEDAGAYPVSVAKLGLHEWQRPSISAALEQHFDRLIQRTALESKRQSLLSQLARVRLAREVAIGDLTQASDAAARAREVQEKAELILAYGPSAQVGASLLEVWDYEGNQQELKLDPTLDYKENAQKMFDKAKRAKSRAAFVREQLVRIQADLSNLEAAEARAREARTLQEIEKVHEQAEKARWLHRQPEPNLKKEERPYEGHRVRETLGPGGWMILYGENAESNDYLTLRVAKPNDWWLHVRGGTSAHVVVPTRNQPDKVPREVLLYAAKVAVLNSPSKHSGYVSVDFTLKKYVRRPKGAPKGTVLYTHEKTLSVD